MFYDEWAPSGEISVSRPSSTCVPRWEDIENDLELDLKELLEQKRKRKEAPTAESESLPRCVRIKAPNVRIVYKL